MRTIPKKKAVIGGKSIGGATIKDPRKNTASTKFREKTLGLKQKQNLDESSLMVVTTQYYKDFSP